MEKLQVKTDLITEHIKCWELNNNMNVLEMPLSKILDISSKVNVKSKLVVDMLIAYDIINK